MNKTSSLVSALGAWAEMLPAATRKRVYQAVKFLAGLGTVVLIVLPYLPTVGVHVDPNTRWAAILTFVLTLLGQLADRNTVANPLADLSPMPEPSASAMTFGGVPPAPPSTETAVTGVPDTSENPAGPVTPSS